MTFFQGNLAWWNILVWPDVSFQRKLLIYTPWNEQFAPEIGQAPKGNEFSNHQFSGANYQFQGGYFFAYFAWPSWDEHEQDEYSSANQHAPLRFCIHSFPVAAFLFFPRLCGLRKFRTSCQCSKHQEFLKEIHPNLPHPSSIHPHPNFPSTHLCVSWKFREIQPNAVAYNAVLDAFASQKTPEAAQQAEESRGRSWVKIGENRVTRCCFSLLKIFQWIETT